MSITICFHSAQSRRLCKISANLKRFVISWTLGAAEVSPLQSCICGWLDFAILHPLLPLHHPILPHTDLSQIVTVPFSLGQLSFSLGWLERYSISGFVTDHHSPIVSARFIIVFCIQIESTLSWFFIHDTLYLRCWWGMYVCARENKGNYLIPPQCHKTAHLFIFICSAVQRCHQKLFGFHPIENIT